MNKEIRVILENTLNNMSKENDAEIVERFNGNVKNKYFNIFLSSYLPAIIAEFQKRKIDTSKITELGVFSYKRKVVLISKILIPLEEN